MDSAKQLGEGRIGPLLAKYALPSIVGMVVGALYNIVDRIFLGRGVGTIALAGVTVSFALQLVQIAFAVLIGVGASALISISLGEQKRDKAELVLGNGFALNMGISVVLAVVSIIFLDPILRICGASEEVLPYAHSFALIVLLGTPFATISQGLNGFIRSEGNPKVAMVTQLIGPVLNVILCPLFIFVFKMGIVGSALATVISQAVGSIWVLAYYFSGKSLLKLRKANLVPRRDVALQIMALGSATALSDLAAAVMNGIMNNQLERFGGDSAVTAMGIVFAISNLVFLTLIGMNMGMQPIVGYNIGARLYGRVRKAELIAISAATIFATLCFALVQLFPHAFVSLFAGSSSGVDELGVYALRHYFLLLPFMGLQVLGSGYFMASGKPLKSLVLGLSRQFLILIPALYILPLFWGLDGVWNAQPVADGLSFVITALLLGRDLHKLGKAETEGPSAPTPRPALS
jgi:putative efflux protein, MATE family